MLTDGCVLPVSTCDRRLADTPTAPATLRRLSLRDSRTRRSSEPTSSCTSLLRRCLLLVESSVQLNSSSISPMIAESSAVARICAQPSACPSLDCRHRCSAILYMCGRSFSADRKGDRRGSGQRPRASELFDTRPRGRHVGADAGEPRGVRPARQGSASPRRRRSPSRCACRRHGRDAATTRPRSARTCATFLAANDLYLYTVNAFPYGPFKGRRVMEDVYEPDWSTRGADRLHDRRGRAAGRAHARAASIPASRAHLSRSRRTSTARRTSPG